MVEGRRMAVLNAIVSDYVRTREPVASRALAERYCLGVSPATIRNDMAALEAEGYINQPHTSAGRVPTHKGYRSFVDHIAAIKPLSGPEWAAIDRLLAGVVDLNDVVEGAVRALAELTGQLAVVEYPSLRHVHLRHLELVPLPPRRLLLVIITDSGRVEQRTLMVEQDCLSDPASLETLRQRLNQALVGTHSSEISAVVSTLLKQTEPDMRSLMHQIAAQLVAALQSDVEERLVVAGTANLARTTADFSSLEPLLDAVEEQVVLLRLLTGATDQPSQSVSVSIGEENGQEALAEASVITTSYQTAEGGGVARLGVLGPTRMDYPAAMASVQAVANYLSRYFNQGAQNQ